MLNTASEKTLSNLLMVGSAFVTIFVVWGTVTDPVNVTKLLALGAVAGVAIVIHPRVIPWILFTQIILFGRLGLKRSLIFFGSLSPIVMLFLIRNKVAHNSWTLSDAADSWMSDIRPENFVVLIKDGIVNAIYFWAPYSGDAKRGTWMHNFTFYHEIKKITHSSTIIILIAGFVGVITITLWMIGTFLLLKSNLLIGKFVFFIPFFAWATDMLTIGDSRHRLVVMPLILIGQVYALSRLQKKLFSRNVRNYEEGNLVSIPTD